MKHVALIITILTLQLPLFSQAIIDGCCVNLTEPASTSLSWSDDSVSFSFTPSEYFWGVSVSNNTTSSMTCLWNETLFVINDLSSRIIFDNTMLVQKNDPLAPGIIAPKTRINKSILPLENVGSYATNPVYTKKIIKHSGERIVTLIIPVQSGSIRNEYKFTFEINLCE